MQRSTHVSLKRRMGERVTVHRSVHGKNPTSQSCVRREARCRSRWRHDVRLFRWKEFLLCFVDGEETLSKENLGLCTSIHNPPRIHGEASSSIPLQRNTMVRSYATLVMDTMSTAPSTGARGLHGIGATLGVVLPCKTCQGYQRTRPWHAASIRPHSNLAPFVHPNHLANQPHSKQASDVAWEGKVHGLRQQVGQGTVTPGTASSMLASDNHGFVEFQRHEPSQNRTNHKVLAEMPSQRFDVRVALLFLVSSPCMTLHRAGDQPWLVQECATFLSLPSTFQPGRTNTSLHLSIAMVVTEESLDE